MESLILERWREKGVIVASSSEVRRNAVRKVLRTENISSIEVPDSIEKDLWAEFEASRMSRLRNRGNVHEIATAKLRWAWAQTKTKESLMFAMDTVPTLTTKAVTESDAQIIWHKPKEMAVALLQLKTTFRTLIRTHRARQSMQHILAAQPKESQAQLEFVRVVTGVAMYVPEIQRVYRQAPFCDVYFDTLAKWVSENEDNPAAETEFMQRLAKSVIDVQFAHGKNPLKIPGTLDYSLLNAGTELDELLNWRIGRAFSPQDGNGVFTGAPEYTIEFMVNNMAHQMANAMYACGLTERFEQIA